MVFQFQFYSLLIDKRKHRICITIVFTLGDLNILGFKVALSKTKRKNKTIVWSFASMGIKIILCEPLYVEPYTVRFTKTSIHTTHVLDIFHLEHYPQMNETKSPLNI